MEEHSGCQAWLKRIQMTISISIHNADATTGTVLFIIGRFLQKKRILSRLVRNVLYFNSLEMSPGDLTPVMPG
jgi:hypothetical protein